MKTIIYELQIWNEVDKRYEVFYIGKTNNLSRRTREHRLASKNGHTSVYQAIRLISELNFEYNIIQVDETDNYNGQEKDHIINTLIENELSNNPYRLIIELFKYKGKDINTFLMNEKFGDNSPEMINYKAKLKLMKLYKVKTVKELDNKLKEDKALLASQKLKDKIIKPKSIKDKIKASPEFIEQQKIKDNNAAKAKLKAAEMFKSILR